MNAAQVCTHAGITYRQLDHWTRAGYLPSAARLTNGTGYPRDISAAECAFVMRLARLVRAGINVKAAAEALADQTHGGVLPNRIRLGDGVEIFLSSAREAVPA